MTGMTFFLIAMAILALYNIIVPEKDVDDPIPSNPKSPKL